MLKNILGYKNYSPFKYNPYNLIETTSGEITMKDVSIPLLALSNKGEKKILMPNSGNHKFKGKKILEIPLQKYQSAGTVKRNFLKEFGIDTRAISDNNTLVIPTLQGNKTLAVPLEKPLTNQQYQQKLLKTRELKKINDAKELARRKEAIKKSDESGFLSRNSFLNSAVGDKMRLFPNDPDSFIDDWINPLKWVGDMADNLGQTVGNPESTVGDYAFAVGTPVAGGLIGRFGARNTRQWANNLVNPFAGINTRPGRPIAATPPLSTIPEPTTPLVSTLDDVSKQTYKTTWQLEELPGLHLKSTMSNNPKGLHTYVAKDGSIDTKSALDHLKRMEGDAKYEVVLKNMQKKYGSNLENMPKRMDYNTLRKNIQDDLWDVGTGKGPQVDEYAGMDMKEFGIIKNDRRISPQHQPTSLSYEKGEVDLVGYSFSNKNKFIGGSDAHAMPKETLGHSRGFTNPKEPGVYYSVERQSNWAQEAGNTLNKTDIELLQRQQKKLPELIKEQDDLIAAGNDTWAIEQKKRFQNQLKEVNSKIDSYNRYANASPQEKLVMKNMHERMLQEDVAYTASQGHTKYRLPSEETMAKIQGFKKETKIDDALLEGVEADELITLQNKYNKMPDNVSDADWDNIYNPIRNRMDELNSKKIVEVGYNPQQSSILKHTKQSLKDAEKLFDVKLKPITDSKGNTWYEFDIPKKFKEGKGEIKAFTVTGAIGTGAAILSQNKNKSEDSYRFGGEYLPLREYRNEEYRNGGYKRQFQKGGTNPPIYTTNPKDSRLQAYNDSLDLYNESTQKLIQQKSQQEKRVKNWNKTVKWYNTRDKGQLIHNEYIPNPTEVHSSWKKNGIAPVKFESYSGYIDPDFEDLGKIKLAQGQSNIPIFKKPVQPVILQKNTPNGTNTPNAKMQQPVKNQQPVIYKPEAKKVYPKPTQQNLLSPQRSELNLINNTQTQSDIPFYANPYTVDYFDPTLKKRTSRYFESDKEGAQFMKDLDPVTGLEQYRNRGDYEVRGYYQSGGLTPAEKQLNQTIVPNNYGMYSGVVEYSGRQKSRPTELEAMKTMIEYMKNNQSDQSSDPSNIYRPQFRHYGYNALNEKPMFIGRNGGKIPCFKCGGLKKYEQAGTVRTRIEDLRKQWPGTISSLATDQPQQLTLNGSHSNPYLWTNFSLDEEQPVPQHPDNEAWKAQNEIKAQPNNIPSIGATSQLRLKPIDFIMGLNVGLRGLSENYLRNQQDKYYQNQLQNNFNATYSQADNDYGSDPNQQLGLNRYQDGGEIDFDFDDPNFDVEKFLFEEDELIESEKRLTPERVQEREDKLKKKLLKKQKEQNDINIALGGDNQSRVNKFDLSGMNLDVNSIKEAIGLVESDGDYSAIGKTVVTSGQYAGERALGKYQVMPGNLKQWSKEVLGKSISPQEFLQNPELQERIVQYKMGEMAAKYGVENVPSIWLTGKPLGQSKAQDDNGTDAKEYTQMVLNKFKKLMSFKNGGSFVSGQEYDLSDLEVENLIKLGYKIEKL